MTQSIRKENNPSQNLKHQLVACLLVGFLTQFVLATSLVGQNRYSGPSSMRSSRASAMWKNRNHSMVNRFESRRAKSPGDLLTVMVDIQTVISNLDQRELKKTTNADAKLDTSATGVSAVNVNYATEADRQFKGDSAFRETRRLGDKFTVSVLDINPRNGNLLIQGTREVIIQGDRRTLVLSGEIRSRDVQTNNSVSSEFIHDMSIRYNGTGNEQNFTRQGWLMKRLSHAWPF